MSSLEAARAQRLPQTQLWCPACSRHIISSSIGQHLHGRPHFDAEAAHRQRFEAEPKLREEYERWEEEVERHQPSTSWLDWYNKEHPEKAAHPLPRKETLPKPRTQAYFPACGRDISRQGLDQHLGGKKHLDACERWKARSGSCAEKKKEWEKFEAEVEDIRSGGPYMRLVREHRAAVERVFRECDEETLARLREKGEEADYFDTWYRQRLEERLEGPQPKPSLDDSESSESESELEPSQGYSSFLPTRPSIHCPACVRDITASSIQQHLDGKPHKQKAVKYKSRFDAEPDLRKDWKEFARECAWFKWGRYFSVHKHCKEKFSIEELPTLWRESFDLDSVPAPAPPTPRPAPHSTLQPTAALPVPIKAPTPPPGPGHCPICRQDGLQYVSLPTHLSSEVHARKLAIAKRTAEWADTATRLDWDAFLKKYRMLDWAADGHEDAVKLAVACADVRVEKLRRILQAARAVGWEFGEGTQRREKLEVPAGVGQMYLSGGSEASESSCSEDSEDDPEGTFSSTDSQDDARAYYYRAMGSKACYYLDPGDEHYMGGYNSEADDEDDEGSSESSEDEELGSEDEDGSIVEYDSVVGSDAEELLDIRWETGRKEGFRLEVARPESRSWNLVRM